MKILHIIYLFIIIQGYTIVSRPPAHLFGSNFNNQLSLNQNNTYNDTLKKNDTLNTQEIQKLETLYLNFDWKKSAKRKKSNPNTYHFSTNNKYHQKFNFKGQTISKITFRYICNDFTATIRPILMDSNGNSLLTKDYSFSIKFETIKPFTDDIAKNDIHAITFDFDNIIETPDEDLLVGFEVLNYEGSIPLYVVLSNELINSKIDKNAEKLNVNLDLENLIYKPYFEYYTYKYYKK